MTCPTTQGTRPCSVADTLTSSNSGSCGGQRYPYNPSNRTVEANDYEGIVGWMDGQRQIDSAVFLHFTGQDNQVTRMFDSQ